MKQDAKIETLLEKYLDGKTNLHEEKTLAEYFKTHSVKPEWMAYKNLFGFYEDSRKKVSDIPFTPPKDHKSKFHYFQKYAAIFMLGLIGTLFYTQQMDTKDLGTYDDPKVALKETKKVFDLISYHINSSTHDIQYLETLEKTKTKYIDNIKP